MPEPVAPLLCSGVVDPTNLKAPILVSEEDSKLLASDGDQDESHVNRVATPASRFARHKPGWIFEVQSVEVNLNRFIDFL